MGPHVQISNAIPPPPPPPSSSSPMSACIVCHHLFLGWLDGKIPGFKAEEEFVESKLKLVVTENFGIQPFLCVSTAWTHVHFNRVGCPFIHPATISSWCLQYHIIAPRTIRLNARVFLFYLFIFEYRLQRT
jgi:hypothetical protein